MADEQTQAQPAQTQTQNAQPAREPQPYVTEEVDRFDKHPRFVELNQRMKAAEKAAQEERAAREAERAELQRQLQERAQEAQTNAMRADLYRNSIFDDEALDIAKIRYETLKPKEGEAKPTFAAFLEAQRNGGAKWLQGYIQGGGQAQAQALPAAQVQTNAPVVPAAQPVQPDGGGAKRPSVSDSLSLDKLMADTSPHAWKAMREQVLPGAKK